MKRLILILPLLLVFFSCEKKIPVEYAYESDPVYSWGYAEFWGDYYSEYEITENVVSLSLFTDDLIVDSTSSLVGIGQYLYLEDVFVASSDTLLPAGTYSISDANDRFSIAGGEELEIDGQVFDVGAFVYFMEKNEMFTIRKFITAGTMKVEYSGSLTRMEFDFTLDDDTGIKGSFEGELPYFDSRFASSTQSAPSRKDALQKLNSLFPDAIQGKYQQRKRRYTTQ